MRNKLHFWHKLRFTSLVVIAISAIAFNIFAAPVSVVSAKSDLSVQNLLTEHNAERKKAGLPPLKVNNALTAAAQRKAQAMLAANCWSHYCPNGKEPWDFFRDAGYLYKVAGENLAEGFFDAEAVMIAWMNSPTHKENVLRGEYEEVGFGIIQGNFQGKNNNVIIVVHFGTPITRPSTGDLVATNGELPTPSITSPANNSAFNTTKLNITGNAPEATQVQLFNAGKHFITTDANEGIFTYNTNLKAGDYTFTAISQIGERRSATSVPITFSIDTTPDKLSMSDLVLLAGSNTRQVLVTKANLQAISLRFNDYAVNLQQSEPNVWESFINVNQIGDSQYVQVATTDRAGNQWEGVLPMSEFKTALQSTTVRANPNQNNSEGRVISATTKTQGNFMFIGLLFVLFAADYFRVKDTGATQTPVHGLAQLHIGLVIILLIVVLSGTFFGQILTGIQL
jgi:uncharacterized protein YkwD